MSPPQTLVILAAGRGTRFGGPKQFTRFGPLAWPLMLYNICHAWTAGIRHLVFVTVPEHKQVLAELVLSHLPEDLTFDIVYQDIRRLPSNCHLSEGREKPLGTAL